MNKVIIQDIINKEIEIIYNKEKVLFPTKVQEDIDNYWSSLLMNGKTLRRGDVFMISLIEEGSNKLKIEVKLTDYAHYMATLNNMIDKKYWCKIIYTSAIVETLDNKIIIGEMAPNTSTPGRLQFPGGGIDKDDVENNSINLEGNITKEIKEELGIDINCKDQVTYFKLHFLKTGGTHDFYSFMFKVKLNFDQSEFTKIYNSFSETLKLKNIIPEFSSLLFLNNEPEELECFLQNNTNPKVDYLHNILQVI